MARSFVTEAVNITADEALESGVIEIVAADVPALLVSLHGRTIQLNGDLTVLETAGATVIERSMSARQKLLKVLANPNLAYILMTNSVLSRSGRFCKSEKLMR